MPRLETQSIFSATRARRLEHLAAAFAEYRRASTPGRWIPRGLRAQVLAALNAGVSASAIQRVCKLSWTQITRWRSAAGAVGTLATPQQAQVLSVVDTVPVPSLADTGVEMRVGPWRISINRADH